MAQLRRNERPFGPHPADCYASLSVFLATVVRTCGKLRGICRRYGKAEDNAYTRLANDRASRLLPNASDSAAGAGRADRSTAVSSTSGAAATVFRAFSSTFRPQLPRARPYISSGSLLPHSVLRERRCVCRHLERRESSAAVRLAPDGVQVKYRRHDEQRVDAVE